MYKLAIKYGYDGGAVLEPAIATGNIINPLPKKQRLQHLRLIITQNAFASFAFQE